MQILETVKAHFKQRGMAIKQGTIIDATLIAGTTSTKKKSGAGSEDATEDN